MALPDDLDHDKLAEAALALLGLTTFVAGPESRAWKGLDWDVLDLLFRRGWIEDPVGKARSVVLTETGRRWRRSCSRGISRKVNDDGDRSRIVVPSKMVVLRATRKLLPLLPALGPDLARSSTALGDWYVNRMVVDRRPLLLLISAASLLPIVVPARDVRGLPERLPGLVAARLGRLGIAPRTIDLETRAMSPVTVATTANRSVVGIMVDFAQCLPFYLGAGRWDEGMLPAAEDKLAETPCFAGRATSEVVFPERRAPELLHAKWEVS